MKNFNLTVAPWADYELLDSGQNKKLERYGSVVIIRPETQAIWQPLRPKEWPRAASEFRFVDKSGGIWHGKKLPATWTISWQNILHCLLRPTSFKHIGIFPEQATNWEWLSVRMAALTRQDIETPPRILNLFGYTGAASIVAAQHGAHITHVDASRQSNAWAKENAALSGVSSESIRYLLDDALKFTQREARRGTIYDGIILDPPAFGRGAKGEVWKIETNLPPLLSAIQKILSPRPGAFFLLNGYAAGYSPRSFRQAVESFLEIPINSEYGELQIEESASDRRICAGVYVRFARQDGN